MYFLLLWNGVGVGVGWGVWYPAWLNVVANPSPRLVTHTVKKIESFEKLYLASYKVLLYEIAHTNAAVDYLAIIAHNPGITELFNYIGNATIDDLPTCGMGIFTFDIDSWDEIAAHKGKLEWYSWPKKVKN